MTATLDAIHDLLTGADLSYTPEELEDFEVIQFTPKDGLTSIDLGDLTRLVIKIDAGDGEPIEPAQVFEIKGPNITLLTHPAGNFGSVTLSAFLSQMKTLHTPLSLWDAGGTSIKSPDFTAPLGVFKAESRLGDGNTENFIDFNGSTFKVAPRIFDTLEPFSAWPPPLNGINAGQEQNGRYCWQPFEGCPNVQKIENQGELHDGIKIIYSHNLTYYEEADDNGYRKPNYSAYPTGGNPVAVWGYIGTRDDWMLEQPPALPSFGTANLQTYYDAYHPNSVMIGWRAPFGGGTLALPYGFDPSKAPNLRAYFFELPRLYFHPTFRTYSFTYGAEALGIKKLPETLETVGGVHDIKRHISNGTYPPAKPSYGYGAPFAQSSMFRDYSYDITQSWQNLYGKDHALKWPELPANVKSVGRWFGAESYWAQDWKQLKPDQKRPTIRGTTSDTKVKIYPEEQDRGKGWQPPALPEGVENVGEYLPNTFEGCAVGTMVNPTINNPTFGFPNVVNVPAYPSTLKTINNYLPKTFKDITAVGKTIDQPAQLKDGHIWKEYRTYSGEWEEFESGRRYWREGLEIKELRRYALLNGIDVETDRDIVAGLEIDRDPKIVVPGSAGVVANKLQETTIIYIDLAGVADGVTIEQPHIDGVDLFGSWQLETFEQSNFNPLDPGMVVQPPNSEEVNATFNLVTVEETRGNGWREGAGGFAVELGESTVVMCYIYSFFKLSLDTSNIYYDIKDLPEIPGVSGNIIGGSESFYGDTSAVSYNIPPKTDTLFTYSIADDNSNVIARFNHTSTDFPDFYFSTAEEFEAWLAEDKPNRMRWLY